MSAPVLTGPAERVGEFFDPWYVQDAENGSPLAWIAYTLGLLFQDVEDVVRTDNDGNLGWARIMDPATAPDWVLPWLAQVAGSRLVDGVAVSAQRALIHPDANKRGTPGAIVAAVKATLTGDQHVQLVERTTSAYQHTVITYTAETPDPTATEAVLSDPYVKPVGHWFTYILASGWTIGEMETVYVAQTIADLEGDFTTISNLEANLP